MYNEYKQFLESVYLIDLKTNKLKAILEETAKSIKIEKISDETFEEIKKLKISIDAINKAKEFNIKMNDIINLTKKIMKNNNGYLFTKYFELLNINRAFLSILEKNNIIEKVATGIYIDPSKFPDDFFIFNKKNSKSVFSHMNALYFHNLTEEIPYKFTISLPRNKYIKNDNDDFNIFYVNDIIFEIGLTEIVTPYGNKVKCYDMER